MRSGTNLTNIGTTVPTTGGPMTSDPSHAILPEGEVAIGKGPAGNDTEQGPSLLINKQIARSRNQL